MKNWNFKMVQSDMGSEPSIVCVGYRGFLGWFAD